MIFSLDGRLSVCADLVRPNTKLVDVGTDHAYLPIRLAVDKKIASAIASDIRQKPLAAGLENIRKYGCEDIVSVRLCSGLDGISPDEADDIVMAGMGGELIVKILENAPWVKSAEKRLILQPMTKAHVIRSYLYENGFSILSETPCTAAGKYYTVICSEYTGEQIDYSESDLYIGKLNNNNINARKYIHYILKKLKNQRLGLAHSNSDTVAIDRVIEDIQQKFGDDYNDNNS